MFQITVLQVAIQIIVNHVTESRPMLDSVCDIRASKYVVPLDHHGQHFI